LKKIWINDSADVCAEFVLSSETDLSRNSVEFKNNPKAKRKLKRPRTISNLYYRH